MEKEKLQKIFKVILPDEDMDQSNEDFSMGWNACIKKMVTKFYDYVDTL